jgi:chemotaxis receptor (MCP) glutamine deamidase CheD
MLDRRDTEVGPGSCKIAHAHGRMIARNLSSELLLVLYADKCKLGKMVRFYDDPVQTAFAETALGMFFKELPGLGLQKSDLRLHAIGGLTATSRCFTYMRRWLRSVNIPLAGTDLATDQARSVWLVLDSGHLIVRSATRTIAAIRPMQPKQLAS